MSFLSKIADAIIKFITGIPKESHAVLVVADNVVNALKTFEGTDLGKFITGVIEPLIPGLGPALQNWLPDVCVGLNWAVAETSKTPDQLAIEGITYLKTIQDDDVKAAQHNTAVALVGKWIGSQTGVALPIQQHLILGQIIHNPAVIGAVTNFNS